MIKKEKGSRVAIASLCLAIMISLFFTACNASPVLLEAQKTAGELPALKIFLRVLKDEEGHISHVEVGLEVSLIDGKTEKPFTLKAPVKYANVTGIADRIENLQVSDDKGIVEMKLLDDISEEGGIIIWRKWESTRSTRGIIIVRYLSRLTEPGLRAPGLPYYLSSEGGGVSGAGYGFMALPEEPGDFKLQLKWDLESLGAGSTTSSSLGDGNFGTVCPIERIFQSWFIAGPLGRYPEQGSINGFSSAWLGNPPFDAKELMAWPAKAFMALKSFFRDKRGDPYRFFMRVGPDYSEVRGTALYSSFMLYLPGESELIRDLRWTIFREMIHKWVGEMEDSANETFWFSEGLTVHYTRVLMYREGLCTGEEYLEDFNSTVTRHFTNPQRILPNDRIGKLLWQEQNGQRIRYDRGSLYFAHVDAKIRKISKGERSPDDLILSLFGRRKNGEKLTRDVWLEELTKELGPSALDEFQSIIIRGEDFIPASDAVGPEFKRVPSNLCRFELGFDEKSLRGPEKQVAGLVKGSSAERAGLQNGDLILNKGNLHKIRRDDNLRLKLKVKREDKILEIEYLPRG